MDKYILENNKKIALYDCAQFQMSSAQDHKDQPLEKFPKTKYHSDWNALMRVIDRIEKEGYEFVMEGNKFGVYDENNDRTWFMDGKFKNTRLENAYDAVVTMIDIINKNAFNG